MAARIISHFEIGERLGEGGIGVVYKATDIHLGRPVAIKFLHPHLLSSEEAVRRFRKEARVLSLFSHPNIATVYEVGEEDGQQFIVLEFLPGGALSSKIAGLREAGLMLSMRQVVEVGAQVAGGLAYAHRQGVIHRDIKPHNILCTLDGGLKLTDFGLARFVQGGEATVAGRIEGTIPYMAPELIRGKDIDSRSDTYSFAVTLFELATGERPYTGPNEAAVLYSILHDPVPSLGRLRPDAPAELERLVSNAMAKDPDQRPQSMDEVATVLAALRERWDTTVGMTGPVSSEALTVTVRTRPSRLTLGAVWRKLRFVAVAGVVLAAAAGALWTWSMRCLLAGSWFEACRIPAYRHVGVLEFEIAGPDESGVLGVGLREYAVGQLARLARFDPSLCVHWVRDTSGAAALKLLIAARLDSAAGRQEVSADLRRTPDRLLLNRMPPVNFAGARFQDDFASALTRTLGLVPDEGARRAMSAGSTGIPEAFHFYLLGLGHLARNQVDESVSAFQKAIAEDPFYASALAGLAEARRRQYHRTQDRNLTEMALESAGTATARDDQLGEAYLALGRIHYDLGRYQLAIQDLQRAVDLLPASPDARDELVRAYSASGDLERAQAVAEKGVELHPDCSIAQYDLGNFYRTLGRFQEAEVHFRRVVELVPGNARAYSNLAATLYDQQKYADAEQAWRQALAHEASAMVYINLGQLYIRTNCYHAAERALAQATAIASNDFLAYGNLGEAYHLLPEHRVRAQGLFAKALQLAERERANIPNDPQVVRMVAFYLARLGNKQRALEGIGQAIALAPDNIHTLYRAGFLYEIAGERERAIAAFERVIGAGYPARELCTHPDLADLRRDPRFPRVAGDTCAPYRAQGTEPFTCPEP
jgi:tetratricopeptide (TPR) repeat protein